MSTARIGREEFVARQEVELALIRLIQQDKLRIEAKKLIDQANDLFTDVQGCLKIARALRYGGYEWFKKFIEGSEVQMESQDHWAKRLNDILERSS